MRLPSLYASLPHVVELIHENRYVFKRGRKTVPPEAALILSELLPPKPKLIPTENENTPPLPSPPSSGTETPAQAVTAPENAADTAATLASAVLPESQLPAFKEPPALELGAFAKWDGDTVEAERQRGMRIAQHLAGLDEAADLWGEEGLAMGEF